MKRASAIILSLLLFWAGVAYGFPGACCCATACGRLMKFADDGCGPEQDHSCNHNGFGCHCKGGCLSLQCAGELDAMALPQAYSVRAEHQVFALPAPIVIVEAGLRSARSISRQFHSFHWNTTNLLLQTCSFLS